MRPVGLRRDVEDVPRCWAAGNMLSSDTPQRNSEPAFGSQRAPDVSLPLYRFRRLWAPLGLRMPMLESPPGETPLQLYEFGDRTRISADEDASISGRHGWGEPAGSGRRLRCRSAAAFHSAAASVVGAIGGIYHNSPDLRPCLRPTPATRGPLDANANSAAPGCGRAGAARDRQAEAGARAGGAAPGRRWHRPVGLDQSRPP